MKSKVLLIAGLITAISLSGCIQKTVLETNTVEQLTETQTNSEETKTLESDISTETSDEQTSVDSECDEIINGYPDENIKK